LHINNIYYANYYIYNGLFYIFRNAASQFTVLSALSLCHRLSKIPQYHHTFFRDFSDGGNSQNGILLI